MVNKLVRFDGKCNHSFGKIPKKLKENNLNNSNKHYSSCEFHPNFEKKQLKILMNLNSELSENSVVFISSLAPYRGGNRTRMPN